MANEIQTTQPTARPRRFNFNARQTALIMALLLSTVFILHFQMSLTTSCRRDQKDVLDQHHGQRHGATNSINSTQCHQQQQLVDASYTAAVLSPSTFNKGWGDIYSGMWWQSIESMMRSNYTKPTSLEGVTFRAFKDNKKLIQTVDWLDLCVEHLSKYVKYFGYLDRELNRDGLVEDEILLQEIVNAVQDRVAEILERYIQRSKKSCHQFHLTKDNYDYHDESVVSSTIAVLPLRVISLEGDYENRLLGLQTAATLASLWHVGFARAIIVGVSENEKIIAQRAFEQLAGHLEIRFMEMDYVDVGKVSDEKEWKVLPKVAMVWFQKVLTEYHKSEGMWGTFTEKMRNKHSSVDEEVDSGMNPIITNAWSGHTPSRFKYIYFSEPDLILHIRPEAVPSLSNELRQDHILNAHRLQPLPHMQQFSDILDHVRDSDNNLQLTNRMNGQLLPNLASFAAIHSLNTAHREDVCLDQGKFYPGNIQDPSTPLYGLKKTGQCYVVWEFCGFTDAKGNYSDWSFLLETHKFLAPYPLISLEGGTGLPMVHHGQRVCVPQRRNWYG